MTDRPTETLVEKALAFVAEFKGDQRCALNCDHSEALAGEVYRLRALLLAAHSGEEPQTDGYDVENVNQCFANGCGPDGERDNTNRSVSTSREHDREMGQPSDEVTASPAAPVEPLRTSWTVTAEQWKPFEELVHSLWCAVLDAREERDGERAAMLNRFRDDFSNWQQCVLRAHWPALREHPVAVETPRRYPICIACADGNHVQCLGGRCECIHDPNDRELSSDPRQIEPPIISREGPA